MTRSFPPRKSDGMEVQAHLDATARGSEGGSGLEPAI